MDSVFSPVTKITFTVEDERVGRMSNFDKLTMDIWTDGSINPETALHDASHTLGSYFHTLCQVKMNHPKAKI